MKYLVAGALILCGALACAQQPSSPQLPAGTTPPTFPQDKQPDKDVGRQMPPDTKATTPSSTEVQQQIDAKLAGEPDLSSEKVQAKVSDKQIVLSGSVSDEEQHQAARRIVESYAGSRKVIDRIKVRSKQQ